MTGANSRPRSSSLVITTLTFPDEREIMSRNKKGIPMFESETQRCQIMWKSKFYLKLDEFWVVIQLHINQSVERL